MNQNIKIRHTTDKDINGIRELFKICFGKELSQEEWNWKYRDSHLGSSSMITEYNDKIIAHYGGFRIRLYSKGEIFNGYQGCDVMTHPEYRARLFTKKVVVVKLAEAFYEANPMDFIFGFPSEKHGKLMKLQLGFEPYSFISVLSKDIKSINKDKKNYYKFNFGWESLRSKDIDRLWEEYKDSFELSLYKDSSYIFWRYKKHPTKRYEIIAVFSGLLKRRLKTLIIFTINNDEMLILDFLLSTKTDILKIFSDLERIAIQRRIKKIRLWVNPLEKIYNLLKDYGYIEERGFPYSIRVFRNSSLLPDYFMKNYCYRAGDYDAS